MGALLLAHVAAGCVEVDGGAVEVGWDLRFPDGRRTDDNGDPVNCNKSSLDLMALALTPTEGGTDPCAGQGHCRFGCSSQGVGTTDFVIPPGDYSIVLQVLDPAGKVLESREGIVGPGPVVRRISTGEITNLSVNLIIVDR